MESSPPIRTRERSVSPADSQYSVNLNALDMDDLTDLDLDVPKQEVQRIFSEDIDGPSDFTQNMEMWMHSGRTPKNTLKGISRGRKSSLAHLIREEKEEEVLAEEQDPHHDPHVLRESGKTTNVVHAGTGHHSATTSHQVNDIDEPYHEDQFSSEWHTYDSTSTPVPPGHLHLLQPTVEDYHSELSPARRGSTYTRGHSLRATERGHPRSVLNGPTETPGQALPPSLPIDRSPVTERTRQAQEKGRDENQQQALDAQVRQLETRCQQLEDLNNALGQALEEEKRKRKQETMAHDAQIIEAERREKDLESMREAAYSHEEEFRREFGELKDKLKREQREVEDAGLGHDESQQGLRAEVDRLRKQLQGQTLEHYQEVKSLEKHLDLERRGRASAEAAAKTHRQETDEQRAGLEAHVSRLQTGLQQMHVEETAMAELERQLDQAGVQIKELQAEKSNIEESLMEQRQQITQIKQSQAQESTRLIAERSRAVELASGFQRQLQELRQQMKEGDIVHEKEMEQLRVDSSKASQVSIQEMKIIRAELEAKQNELNEAILERDAAQDALEARSSREDALKAELVDMKAVNATLDARISEKLQKREQHWKGILDEGNKERRLMAKALLHQWGREEVGIDSPQLYAYRYLSKTSPGESPTLPKSKAAS